MERSSALTNGPVGAPVANQFRYAYFHPLERITQSYPGTVSGSNVGNAIAVYSNGETAITAKASKNHPATILRKDFLLSSVAIQSNDTTLQLGTHFSHGGPQSV